MFEAEEGISGWRVRYGALHLSFDQYGRHRCGSYSLSDNHGVDPEHWPTVLAATRPHLTRLREELKPGRMHSFSDDKRLYCESVAWALNHIFPPARDAG